MACVHFDAFSRLFVRALIVHLPCWIRKTRRIAMLPQPD